MPTDIKLSCKTSIQCILLSTVRSHMIATLQSITVSADELQLHISLWLQCGLLMPSSEIRCQTTETTGIFLSFLPIPSSIQNHSNESTLHPVQKTEKIRCNLLCYTLDRALLSIFPLCSNSLIGSVGFRTATMATC